MIGATHWAAGGFATPVSFSTARRNSIAACHTSLKYRPRPCGHCVGTRSRPGRGSTSSSLLNGARTTRPASTAAALGGQSGEHRGEDSGGHRGETGQRDHSRSASPHYRSHPSGAHGVHPFSKPKPGSNLRVRAFSPMVRTSDSSKPSSLVAWMSILMSSFAPAPASQSMTSRVTLPMSRT